MVLLILLPGCSKDISDEKSLSASNNLSLGVSANDLLSQETYTSLRLEVIYVSDFAPSPTTLDQIKAFLEEYTYKPGGINIVTKAISSPGGGSYEISEISNIETESRSAFTTGEEIAVSILFLDGKSATQEDGKLILGTAYKNTSMVIFEETIRKLSTTSGIARSEIESTTIKHEFGHLFGLVDNGSPAQSAHEDSESKSHCDVASCIMVASVGFGKGAIDLLKNKQSVTFDPKCRQDLQSNGGR